MSARQDVVKAPDVRYGKPTVRREAPDCWVVRVAIGAPYGGSSVVVAPSWERAIVAALAYAESSRMEWRELKARLLARAVEHNMREEVTP